MEECNHFAVNVMACRRHPIIPPRRSRGSWRSLAHAHTGRGVCLLQGGCTRVLVYYGDCSGGPPPGRAIYIEWRSTLEETVDRRGSRLGFSV